METTGTILKQYESITGAKINADKSVAFAVGLLDRQDDLLGVWFGPDLNIDKKWQIGKQV